MLSELGLVGLLLFGGFIAGGAIASPTATRAGSASLALAKIDVPRPRSRP